MAATVDLMVSRIGAIAPFLLILDHFGPIRDTIKAIVAITGTQKRKKNADSKPYSLAGYGKIGKQLLCIKKSHFC